MTIKKYYRVSLKRSFITSLALISGALFFNACDKGNGPGPGGQTTTVFKPSDFEVYNLSKEPNANNDAVRVEFSVKNTKSIKYVPNTTNGEFMVYIKMKASDGAYYDYKYLLNSDMNPGASRTCIYTFGVPVEGMTLDAGTFSYEVQYRD